MCRAPMSQHSRTAQICNRSGVGPRPPSAPPQTQVGRPRSMLSASASQPALLNRDRLSGGGACDPSFSDPSRPRRAARPHLARSGSELSLASVPPSPILEEDEPRASASPWNEPLPPRRRPVRADRRPPQRPPRTQRRLAPIFDKDDAAAEAVDAALGTYGEAAHKGHMADELLAHYAGGKVRARAHGARLWAPPGGAGQG